jgi:hypothetical protein
LSVAAGLYEMSLAQRILLQAIGLMQVEMSLNAVTYFIMPRGFLIKEVFSVILINGDTYGAMVSSPPQSEPV